MKAGTLTLAAVAVAVMATSLIVVSRMLQTQLTAHSYAALSSLRSDPEGAKLLYDSLQETTSVQVERNYREPSLLACQNATVLFLGVPVDSLHSENLNRLEALSRRGCRVLVAFSVPERALASRKFRPTIDTYWGVLLSQQQSRVCMTGTGSWKPLLQQDSCVVAIERTWGAASMALVSQPSLFANKTFAQQNVSGSLATLLGTPRTVILDEFQHGVVESGSMVGLARAYRLQGLLLSLLLLAALYLWQRSMPFPSPESAVRLDTTLEGRSAFSGLANLLASHVPLQDVPQLCWDRWKMTRGRRHSDSTVQHVDSLFLPPAPLERYQAIQAALREKPQHSAFKDLHP